MRYEYLLRLRSNAGLKQFLLFKHKKYRKSCRGYRAHPCSPLPFERERGDNAVPFAG